LSFLFYFLIASKNGTGKIGDIGVLEIIAERVYLYQTGGWRLFSNSPSVIASKAWQSQKSLLSLDGRGIR